MGSTCLRSYLITRGRANFVIFHSLFAFSGLFIHFFQRQSWLEYPFGPQGPLNGTGSHKGAHYRHSFIVSSAGSINTFVSFRFRVHVVKSSACTPFRKWDVITISSAPLLGIFGSFPRTSG